ncbi:MAG: triose-phosphate isomerase [archaeon]
MKKPIIIVNFKTYIESSGANAIRLAKICEKVSVETGTDIRVAVSAPDIYPVSKAVTIPVYAEHVDPYPPGRNTGSVLIEIVKVDGATGTLLNHSEHKIPLNQIAESIKRAAKVSVTTIVCAESPEEEESICPFKPEFIAIEPPELIGGNISVSTAHPELISRSVRTVKERHNLRLLVGAGIHTNKDVHKAMELGADGILLSSAITLAPDPEKILRELILH